MSSKEVFLLRKQGHLDEALGKAQALMAIAPDDEWHCRAYAWCLIDLAKREIQNGGQEKAKEHLAKIRSMRVLTDDEILQKQLLITEQQSNPDYSMLIDAQNLSKKKRHEDAASIYRNALTKLENNAEIATKLGWEIYHIIQSNVKSEVTNHYEVKKLLQEYMALPSERPSILHSRILEVALRYGKTSDLKHIPFLQAWDFSLLLADDFQDKKTDNGLTFPSLAERALQYSARDCLYRKDRSNAPYIITLIEKHEADFPANKWLIYYYAQLLLLVGNQAQAAKKAQAFTKTKAKDFWAWALLAQTYKETHKDSAIACYARALLCDTQPHFLGGVRTEFASLLAAKAHYENAKYEIDQVLAINSRNNWKNKPELLNLTNQAWYDVQQTVKQADYHTLSIAANALLYADLPVLPAVIGATFSAKSGKKHVEIFVKKDTNRMPVKTVIQAHHAQKHKFGHLVNVRCELFDDGNITIHELQSDGTLDHDAFFTKLIGVVTGIDKKNRRLFVITSGKLTGAYNLEPDDTLPEAGTALSLYVGQNSKGSSQDLTVFKVETTNELPGSDIYKAFHEPMRLVGNFGFTDSNIFIPDGLISDAGIADDITISGMAVLNYNKNKLQWSWKAIKIEVVYETIDKEMP